MSGPQFFQTRMGQKFYEADVPRITKSLERIAIALERIANHFDPEMFPIGEAPKKEN